MMLLNFITIIPVEGSDHGSPQYAIPVEGSDHGSPQYAIPVEGSDHGSPQYAIPSNPLLLTLIYWRET